MNEGSEKMNTIAGISGTLTAIGGWILKAIGVLSPVVAFIAIIIGAMVAYYSLQNTKLDNELKKMQLDDEKRKHHK
jgi:hypothetical protein